MLINQFVMASKLKYYLYKFSDIYPCCFEIFMLKNTIIIIYIQYVTEPSNYLKYDLLIFFLQNYIFVYNFFPNRTCIMPFKSEIQIIQNKFPKSKKVPLH